MSQPPKGHEKKPEKPPVKVAGLQIFSVDDVPNTVIMSSMRTLAILLVSITTALGFMFYQFYQLREGIATNKVKIESMRQENIIRDRFSNAQQDANSYQPSTGETFNAETGVQDCEVLKQQLKNLQELIIACEHEQ